MDQMKDYKQLIKELPSNTIVCAVGEFNPPTVGHELLVKTVKKLAEQKHSAHVIYTSPSKNSLIQEDKKAHYLNLMFPKTSFKSINESNLQEVITELHKKYKKIILVVGTDQITEIRKLQNVELIPVDKDPEADYTKMKQFATKGIYEEFKKKLPSTIRDIDGKRLMNEMRTGLGLEPIKEQIVFVKDKLREKYFRGEIFNEGDIVESNGEKFTIVKRGSNHLLLKEATGKLISKWIQDVKPTEEKEMNESKLAEGAMQPNGTDKIDTKTSEPMNDDDKTADVKVKKGMITFYNYSKAQNIKEQKHKGNEAQADHKKDNESDIDADFDSHQADKREVGHTLVSPGGQDNLRRRKVKYHLGEASALEKFRAAAAEREKKHDDIEAKRKADVEQGKENMSGSIDRLEKQLNKEQTGMELAKKIHQKGMTTYGKEGGHELTAQHIATDPEHTAKQKKLAQSFLSRMQGVAENVTPDKASNEVAKANLSAKHAKEKESLADKHAREKESLSEAEYTGKGAGKPGWMLRADPKLALALKKAKERRKFVAGTPTKTNDSVEEEREFEIGFAHNKTTKMTYKNITADDAKHAIQKVNDKPKKDHSLVHLYDHEKDSFHNPKTGKKMKDQFNESHVEFRIDHRDKVTGDHKSTFADHEAKVSDTTDKATYVKVPSNKADSFKTSMKSKHGVRVELAESNEHYEKAEQHKDDAESAKEAGDKFSYHMHMADHHGALADWHYSKGRNDAGDKHAEKAGDHEMAAHAIKEETKPNKKKPLAGVVATDKPFDPFFEEEELEERAKFRRKFINGEWIVDTKNTVDENYDQTIEVATPNTAIETSEEDDIDDAEIEAMIGNLSDEEIMDEYGEDELGLVDDETGEEIPKVAEEDALDEQAIMEVLSRVERMKAKFRIRRTSAKRERATKIALKRYSNTATINKRARRLAIKLIKQRMLRGRDPSKLSVGEKERIERALEQRKVIIGRIATRLTPRIRKVEKARMSHTKYTQSNQPSVF
jgi:hypothetical protein